MTEHTRSRSNAQSDAQSQAQSQARSDAHSPPRVRVQIDGAPLDVPEGTTVAAALAMRGIGGTRASVRGEPRMALCGMGICQECRVTIDGVPHRLACQTVCVTGMNVVTGNAAS